MGSRTNASFRNIGLRVLAMAAIAGAPFFLASTSAWAERNETPPPPPRSAADIVRLLEEQATDVEARDRLLTEAFAQPPQTSDKTELAKFYYQRGVARGKTMHPGKLEDFRKAVEYSKSGEFYSKNTKFGWPQDLAVAEYTFGNFNTAIELMKKLAKVIGTEYGLGAHSKLVQFLASVGNIEEAEKWMKETEKLYKKNRSRRKGRCRGGCWDEYHINRGMAKLAAARGNWIESEAYSRERLKSIKNVSGIEKYPTLAFWIRRDIIKAIKRQGRLVDAEVAIRELLKEAMHKFGRSVISTYFVVDLASILGEKGQFIDAMTLMQNALSIMTELGVPEGSVMMVATRYHLGQMHAIQGEWKEAAETFEFVRKNIGENRILFEKWFVNNATFALTALKTGRAEAAAASARSAHTALLGRLGAKHYVTAEAMGVLAMALSELGQEEEALALFGEALPILLSRSRSVDDESGGSAAQEMRRRLIVEGYLSLLSKIRGGPLEKKAGLDAAAEAFRLADVARGSSVQRALAKSSARATARDPALAEVARAEQDALRQIRALYALLAAHVSAPSDQQDPAVVTWLRQRIEALRDERAKLAEQIEAQFPDYADLINPKSPSLAEAQASLRPHEALIATYVGEDRTYVWAVPHQGEVAFATLDMNRDAMAERVGIIRSALDPSVDSWGFDFDAAYDLYAELLKPVQAGWKDATSLIVVAHGPLGRLPLAVLPTAPGTPARRKGEPLFTEFATVPWLGRTHAVTMVPTVAAMKILWSAPAGGTAAGVSFAGFGDPYFSAEQAETARREQTKPIQVAELRGEGGLLVPRREAPATRALDSAQLAALPRLPDTAEEILSIARTLGVDPENSVFLGLEANEATVKNMDLSDRRIVAFATHGLIPGDLDGLTQPALALSAPAAAGVEGDGLLTMGEVLGLKLNADWVVLSACNTASGEGAGAEAVSGLGRAFFYAGARALLVSHWPVETTSARLLTTGVFRRQAEDPGLSRAEALQLAMLDLMDGPAYRNPKSGRVIFSYAHPMFWAPFTIIGDGGIPSGRRPELPAAVRAAAAVALPSSPATVAPETASPAGLAARGASSRVPFITVKNANVRRGPTTSAPKVTTLAKGTRLTVLGEAPGGWRRVARDGKELGFVWGNLIAPLQ